MAESSLGGEPGRTGNFVFLSHSHRDLVQVRQVRDDLEAEGHFPLLFFLKCLDDDSEVDDLIKREIEARDWFLLCDSPNASASRWVRTELEHIASFPDKYWTRVELDADEKTRLAQVHDLSKRMTVFLAYAHVDSPIAERVARWLRGFGYRVIPDFTAGEEWPAACELQLSEAVHEGFVLLLMTPRSVQPDTPIMDEMMYAVTHRTPGARNIVPLLVEQCFPPEALSRIQWIDWTDGEIERHVADLVLHHLRTAEMD